MNADSVLVQSALRKITRRLIPFLFVLYIAAWLDRVNVGFAALQMNSELEFSAEAFGFGSGIFFLGYCLFEVPSNLILHRVGARLWIARIMISWGLIASAMAFVRTPFSFHALRFLLGVAEADSSPGTAGDSTPDGWKSHEISAFTTAVGLYRSTFSRPQTDDRATPSTEGLRRERFSEGPRRMPETSSRLESNGRRGRGPSDRWLTRCLAP